MDIKLMRNSEKGIFYSINDRLLMQITDDNYQYQGLQGKKYFILNAATNEKFEVASPGAMFMYFSALLISPDFSPKP